MEKHYYRAFYSQNESKEYASKRQMELLIRENPIDQKIASIFPLVTLFRDGTNSIPGSKNFLDAFETVDCEKMDLVESLKDIQFVEFDDHHEIVLKFIGKGHGSEGLKSVGTYLIYK